MNLKENKVFNNWLRSDNDERKLQNLWKLTGDYRQGYQPDVEAGMNSFREKMSRHRTLEEKVAPKFLSSKLLKMAAAIVLLLGVAFLFRNEIFKSRSSIDLVTEQGASQSKILEDGSKITLNQSGKLTYPEKFSEKKREVSLEGEAFFEIAKDEKHAFLINTDHAAIEVLGTSFNVRSYPHEETFEVFVKNGKVKVTLRATDETFTLTEGDYFVYNIGQRAVLRKKDLAGVSIAWMNGSAYFKDQSFREIFEGIERLYQVQLEVQNRSLLDCQYTVSLEAGKLEEALHSIQIGCQNISFQKVEAQKYTVSGKCCQ